MERPANITPALYRAVIIIHAVGLIGLIIPATQRIFLMLVPYHLLVMFGIIMYNHAGAVSKAALFTAIVFVLGYAAEYIGVHTEVLFGRYGYGPTLGFAVAGIPLIMGVNWFLLIYATGTALSRMIKGRPLTRILTGAILLVLLDLLIEPVAIKFDYWHWQGDVVPILNYGCWFIVAALFLGIFELFKFTRQNKLTILFLVVQFIFFAVLDLFR